ncbi:MAG: hypothetical protein ACD_74C00295G0005 [uncultured bacterium]|nr:MAG: hypothetical protein ACD_74C00295G0005 [uncultured bacterium]
MSIFDPKLCLKYIADFFPLMRDLYYRKNFSEPDLRSLIAKHKASGGPEDEYVLGKLLDFRIVDHAPDADNSYEIPIPVRQFLDFLLREHSLSQPSILEGYVKAMGISTQDIEAVIREGDADKARRLITDIEDQIERLRQMSRSNRNAIIAEVLRVKGNLSKESTKVRYGRINHIRTRYVTPLRSILQVDQPIQNSFDDLEKVLIYGCEVFDLTAGMPEDLKRLRMRVLRLNKDVREDFEEARKEIDPLYQQLYRESRIARGASVILESIEKNGTQPWDFPSKFAIPVWRVEGLWSDHPLRDLITKIQDCAQTSIPPRIDISSPAPKRNNFVPLSAVRQRLKQHGGDVEDLWPWIIEAFPEQPLQSALAVFGGFVSGKHKGSLLAEGEPVRFAIPGTTTTITSYAFKFQQQATNTPQTRE